MGDGRPCNSSTLLDSEDLPGRCHTTLYPGFGRDFVLCFRCCDRLHVVQNERSNLWWMSVWGAVGCLSSFPMASTQPKLTRASVAPGSLGMQAYQSGPCLPCLAVCLEYRSPHLFAAVDTLGSMPPLFFCRRVPNPNLSSNVPALRHPAESDERLLRLRRVPVHEHHGHRRQDHHAG